MLTQTTPAPPATGASSPPPGSGVLRPVVVERDYPAWLGGSTYGPWVVFGLTAFGCVLVGWAAGRAIVHLLRKAAGRSEHRLVKSLVKHMERPLLWLIPLLLLQAFGAPAAPWPTGPGIVERAVAIGMIGVLTMAVLGALSILEEWLLAERRIDVPDNLEARRVHTQVRVIGRLLRGLVIFVGVALALITFPAVRQVGTSLLASAGIAGIIIGVAAGPVIGNVLAGLQVAFTEPIRIDDVVVVEGEWGRVEEITTTFVVVRIWDNRRLVLPLRYFIEKPVVNWTRQSAAMLTAVKIYTDYTAPVAAIREHLRVIVSASDKWDGRVCAVHVTDCNDKTMEIRLLAGVTNGSEAFDLQCAMREQMVAFLLDHYPSCLPRHRMEPLAAASTPVPGAETSGFPDNGVRAR